MLYSIEFYATKNVCFKINHFLVRIGFGIKILHKLLSLFKMETSTIYEKVS